MRILQVFTLSFSVLASLSCSQDFQDTAATTPTDETPSACFQSGDILVSNSGSDVVLVLNPDGTYKDIVYNVTNGSENIYGLAWSADTNEVLISVDGTDRIMAVSAEDCSERNLITDANLNGNIRGVAQLTAGDIVVVESNAVERFTSSGIRVTAGSWPKNLQTTGTNIFPLSDGGFILCSTGTDVVRTYDVAGTQVATRSSGIGATTDAAGCTVLSDGTIAVAWSGTTDTVGIYSANLGTVVATYSNTSILSAPGGIAQRANGNLLVIDRVLNYIIEITSAGAFVNIIGDGVLSTPEYLLVVP